MFHIVFNADENYIKYTAVLMTSIIKATDTSKKFSDLFGENTLNELANLKKVNLNDLDEAQKSEGYTFHILSNFISDKQLEKLSTLQESLNEIYPVSIQTHIIDEKKFVDLKVPKWHGNYMTYYSMCLDSVLDKRINKALYLDTDMLVLGDIRHLFTIDISKYILATTEVYDNKNAQHYNCGFILFNLANWRNLGIEAKCLDFARKNYNKIGGDQDIYNAVVKNETTLKLPLCWNYWLQTIDTDNYPIYEHFQSTISQIRIIHYIRPKPWINIDAWLSAKIFVYLNMIDLWWNVALETPIFGDELYEVKVKNNNTFAKNMQKLLDSKHHTGNPQDSAVYRIKNSIEYRLGSAVLDNSNNLKGFIRMPFVLSYIVDMHRSENARMASLSLEENPSLAIVKSIENLSDYKEALALKEDLPYRAGKSLIAPPLSGNRIFRSKIGRVVRFLLFDLRKLKKEFAKSARNG